MEKITHQQARNLLQDLVDRPLSSASQARLEAHLGECGDCRQYAETLHLLENDLRRVMQEHWHGQPGYISIPTIQTRSRRLRVRNTIWNSVKLLAAIALLAIFLLVVNSFLHQPGSFSAAGNQATQASTTNQSVSPSPTGEFQTAPTVVAIPAASAEWVAMATTDFGKLIFTMDASGTSIKRISYQFSGWKCGSTTYSSEVVDAAGWLITAGQFSVITTFDQAALTHMYLDGSYDKTNHKLSGTWDFVSSVTNNNCSGSGKWEAFAQTQVVWTVTPTSTQTLQAFRFGDPVESASNALIAAQSGLRASFEYIQPLTVVKVEQMSYEDYSKFIGGANDRPAGTQVWLVVYWDAQFQAIAPAPKVTPIPPFHGCVVVVINAADGLPLEVIGGLPLGKINICDQQR